MCYLGGFPYSGTQWGWTKPVETFFKYVLVCSTEERTLNRFVKTWEWVIYHFWVNYPFILWPNANTKTYQTHRLKMPGCVCRVLCHHIRKMGLTRDTCLLFNSLWMYLLPVSICLCLGSESVTCNSNCCCALLHTQIKGLHFSGCSRKRPPPTPRASCSTSDVLSLSKIYLLYIFIVIKCLPSGEKCKVVLNCDYIYSIYMPYLKCTEELCPLGFQTHISSGAWGSQRLLSFINTVFGEFLLQDVGHAFFCAMCTYSLNEIVFFNFDEQVVDRSIYCYVEEYCAVFWSALSVSVYFSCSCECACVFASPYWGIRISYESADPRVIIASCLRTDIERNIYKIWYNLERKHNKMDYEWCNI